MFSFKNQDSRKPHYGWTRQRRRGIDNMKMKPLILIAQGHSTQKIFDGHKIVHALEGRSAAGTKFKSYDKVKKL